MLKWTAIGLAVLAVLGIVGAYAVYHEAKPCIEQEYPTPVYQQSQTCASTAPCNALPTDAAFSPTTGARSLRAHSAVSNEAVGAVRVVVKDPQGGARFDKTYSAASSSSGSDDATWQPASGSWTVETTYTGFVGTLVIEIDSVGLPPGTL